MAIPAMQTTLLVLLVAVSLLSTALADTYPVVLTGHSPMLKYLPGIIRNETAMEQRSGMWNMTYNDAITTFAVANEPVGAVGPGDQVMWANGASGATAPSVNYSFVGTGITFRGYWNAPLLPASAQASVELVVDGKSTTANGQDGGLNQLVTLVSATGLDNGKHDVQLFVRSSTVSIVFVESVLDFAGVSGTAILKGENDAYQQSLLGVTEASGDVDRSPSIIYGVKSLSASGGPGAPQAGMELNPDLVYKGNWAVLATLNNSPFPSIGTETAQGTLTANLGSGNMFVRVNGTLAPMDEGFSVRVVPTPPNGVEVFTGNAHAHPWNGNGTFYMAALHPDVSYSITLQNISPANVPTRLWIQAIEMWKGNRTEHANTTPTNTGSGSSTLTGSTSTAQGNANGNGSANGTGTGNGNGTGIGSGSDSATKDGSEEGKAKTSTPVGAIVGGVVGGIVAVILAGILGFFLGRRTSRKSASGGGGRDTREGDFDLHDDTIAQTGTAPTAFTMSSVGEEGDSTVVTAGYEPKLFQPEPQPPQPLQVQPSEQYAYQETLAYKFQPKSAAPSSTDPSIYSSIISPSIQPQSTSRSTEIANATRLMTPATTVHPGPPASVVDQEEDAGALVPISEDAEAPRRIIPPKYNPSWAPSTPRSGRLKMRVPDGNGEWDVSSQSSLVRKS